MLHKSSVPTTLNYQTTRFKQHLSKKYTQIQQHLSEKYTQIQQHLSEKYKTQKYAQLQYHLTPQQTENTGNHFYYLTKCTQLYKT